MFRGISKKNLNTYIKFFQFTYNNGINWLQKALPPILKNMNTQKDKSDLLNETEIISCIICIY